MPSRTKSKKAAPVTIAVMGSTGSGKTTFINLASNSQLRVGFGLESCTDTIQYSQAFTLDGYSINLVDTPGFDDTVKSDAEILNIVCDYFKSTYSKGQKLHGIIYLHRITDNRMAGTAMRNFRFFQHLCGEETLKNCAIVTNMWDQIKSNDGEARETELFSKDIFFKPAVDNGAKRLRHDNTVESAHKIIRQFLENTPTPLAIQRELVDEKKRVFETVAGETLLGEFAALAKKQQEELDELKRELEEAQRERDETSRQEIEEALAKLQAEQKKLAGEQAKIVKAPTNAPNAPQGAGEIGRKVPWWKRLPFLACFRRGTIDD